MEKLELFALIQNINNVKDNGTNHLQILGKLK